MDPVMDGEAEEICQGWEGDSLESLVKHVETAYLASA